MAGPLLAEVCSGTGAEACRRVLDWTDNETLARVVGWLADRPFKILVIVVVGLVLNALVRRAIRRFAAGVARVRQRVGSPGEDTRVTLRSDTLVTVLRSAVGAVIATLVAITVIGELGVNLGAFVATATVVGAAVGFGAQSIVRDFLAGFFMLVEDQMGVGDVVDVGVAEGVVEKLTLRTTRLRDNEGTVWHVPNGQILKVGNKSQEWARALLDVNVPISEDLDHVMSVLHDLSDTVKNDPEISAQLLGDLRVAGVESIGDDRLVIRLRVRTKPGEQWQVLRRVRLLVVQAFKAAGIAPLSGSPTVVVHSPQTPPTEIDDS